MVAPLTYLTGEEPFVWFEPQQAVFNQVKALITYEPVLALSDFEKPFILETDASNFETGSVILQMRKDGLAYPVLFASKKIQLAETKYHIHGKELLAILTALKE